jgi:outer membrane biosynthesis protein TonB
MDFRLYEFLKEDLLGTITAMFELVKKVVDFLLQKEAAYLVKIADLEARLATALGNDAADAETIATANANAEAARIEAEAAGASLATANQLLAEDKADDEKLVAFLQPIVDSIPAPEPEPTPEPEPEPEPEPTPEPEPELPGEIGG